MAITLINDDCMNILASCKDNSFDLAIVDPPYGIDINSSPRIVKEKGWAYKDWDKSPPPKEYFSELFRVSTNQIIWGGNYFIGNLKETKCFLIWDKKITETHSFAMSEFAWTSFNSVAKTFYSPPPGNRGFYNIDGERIHPTQKPIALYKWILTHYAKEGNSILDTHLGSGSSAIACNDLGFDFTGIELDVDYFQAATKRLEEHQQQLQLFKS